MRLLAATAVILPALTLAACSGQSADSAGDFEGAQKPVAELLEDVEDAARDDDAKRLCTLLAPDLARQIGRGDARACVKRVDDALEDSDSGDIKVERVRIAGDQARAEIEQKRSGDDERVTVTLVRDGRVWRLRDLAGAIR